MSFAGAIRHIRRRAFANGIIPITISCAISGSSISCAGASYVDTEIAKSGPGVVTVIEFIDYECSFCQDTHELLAPLVEEQRGAVRLIIKHVPLPEHSGAKRAAAAAVCAEQQGKLAPVHDALMRGASKSSDDGLLDLAQHAGLDIEAFKACMRSDAPAARIREDEQLWTALGGDGVPMVFIDRRKLVGLQDEATLESALREAAR